MTRQDDFNPSMAIVFIGTGGYAHLFDLWFDATQRLITPDVRRTFYAFTDVDLPTRPGLVAYFQQHLPWPEITLSKWGIIERAATELTRHTHILYLDADMIAVQAVLFDEVFGNETAYVGVQDPSHWAGESWICTWPGEYETDTTSPAAVTESTPRSIYWQACLWGGRVTEVLPMITELKNRTHFDTSRGFTARWHDESYLNRYLLECRLPVRTLGPEYACPPGWSEVGGRKPKIMHVAKDDAKLKIASSS